MIPILLLDSRKRLVKTIAFGERTYIGDPFNVVRIFNEKEVDELCVLDIDATHQGRGPDFDFLGVLASECFIPLSYGGGIRTREDCERLNRLGVEKFVIGSAAKEPGLVAALAGQFGAQAVVGCVDVRGSGRTATCVCRNAEVALGLSPLELARRLEGEGVGEILLQSVDQDGRREGYDLELIRDVAPQLRIPVIAAGGARGIDDLIQALQAGASAAASGSAFCFIGRLRAVLISYPSAAEISAANTGTRKVS